ncbi:hypothetical protein [Bradyrhizobium lablabi]|uniref:hypothetical protein n=1 Tax=Bradyrhizobium lablabi TaxID=722472 RepID=UPI001BA6D6AD|nr:hypothetical protein [Bradyrhizobium lablabi]MBR0698267.1 hypothetical protein [Bradyrhizobium lablabi]
MLDMLATFWMDCLGPMPPFYFDYGYQKVNSNRQSMSLGRVDGANAPDWSPNKKTAGISPPF